MATAVTVLPFLFILLATLLVYASESNGTVDVTAEQIVFFFALYIAIPYGLANVVFIRRIHSKGLIEIRVAAVAFALSGCCVLVGLIAWTWFYMVASIGS